MHENHRVERSVKSKVPVHISEGQRGLEMVCGLCFLYALSGMEIWPWVKAAGDWKG